MEEEYENEQGEEEMEDEQELPPEFTEREEREPSIADQNERSPERRRSEPHHEQRRKMSSPGMPRGPRFSHLPEWQRVSCFLITTSFKIKKHKKALKSFYKKKPHRR